MENQRKCDDFERSAYQLIGFSAILNHSNEEFVLIQVRGSERLTPAPAPFSQTATTLQHTLYPKTYNYLVSNVNKTLVVGGI